MVLEPGKSEGTSGLQTVFDAVSTLLTTVAGAESFAGPMARQADRLPDPRGDGAAAAFAQGVDWTATATPATRAAVTAFLGVRFDWVRPYEGDPRAGRGFAEGAAYCMLSGAAAAGAAADFSGGFFIVAADVDYHDHRHGPTELYLPLSGRARYWTATGGWRQAAPGTAMVHAPWEWHAMQTRDEPVLIFWAWRNEDRVDEALELRESFGGRPA